MIFYSFFKTLVGKEVTVELKNDLAITGVLHSVDQYLNIKLTEIRVGEPERHPQASFFFPSSFSSSFFRKGPVFAHAPTTKTTKTPTAGDGEKRIHPRLRGAIRQGKESRSGLYLFFRLLVVIFSFFDLFLCSLSFSFFLAHAFSLFLPPVLKQNSSPPTVSTPSSSTTRRGGRRGGSRRK